MSLMIQQFQPPIEVSFKIAKNKKTKKKTKEALTAAEILKTTARIGKIMTEASYISY